MKKTLIASLVIATSALVSFPTLATPSGSIIVDGAITASTCDVALDNDKSGNGTVSLPKLSTRNLAKAGDTAGGTSFVIKLTNCTPATGGVRAWFETGAAVDAVTGRLINTNTTAEGAENVDVQLLNDKEDVLQAGSSSQRTHAATDLVGGAANLVYKMRYYAVTDDVKPGKVDTKVTYSIDYD
ncbi:fimbrial protein [Erwinia sp. ErVv1]|uniref:fimbrial protein n=1 Tax=Erwinia sp. ErVv1 TaxID=1603299 RepID=UPI000834A3CF|nr:fimbrial protein [Erwinia sp. ErVv1]